MPTATYDFVITVLPCIMKTFTSDSIRDVEVTVFDPVLTTKSFKSYQNPNCNYAETYTFSGVPDFVTFDEASKTFSILTDSADNVGIYQIKMTSQITVPDNASKASFTVMETKTSF